jgi:hypothetical protein
MIRRIAQGFIVFGLVLASSQARAGSKDGEVDAADLYHKPASPKVKVDLAPLLPRPADLASPKDFDVEITTKAGKQLCKILIDNTGTIKPASAAAGGKDACTPLWSLNVMEGGQSISLTFDAADTPIAAGPVSIKIRAPSEQDVPKLTYDKDKRTAAFDKTFGAGSPATPLLFFENTTGQGEKWEAVPVGANGAFDVPSFLTGENRPKEVTVLANFDKDGKDAYTKLDLDLKREEDSGGSRSGGGGGFPPRGGPTEKFADFCSRSADDKVYVVCADLFTKGEDPAIQIRPQTRHILKPNRPVLVKVRHRRDAEITIKMDGERGLFHPGIRVDVTPRKGAGVTESTDGEAPLPPDIVSEVAFAPRRPGPADVKIRQIEGGKETSYTIELVVEEIYLGAVRLGVAAIQKDAVDREYLSQARPGSQQTEIVAKSTGRVDLELVLGFAPYLFDFIGDDGRAAVTGCRPCVAPYVGLGLLNQSATSLELLKSLHFGLEWEFTPSFSVAGTFVVRRVTRLASGFEVGSPIGADVPTTTGYGFGGGVVFNFSPEFLKLAAQSSSVFFK